MFDRILLALDDSPAGEMATVFAGALARTHGRVGARPACQRAPGGRPRRHPAFPHRGHRTGDRRRAPARGRWRARRWLGLRLVVPARGRAHRGHRPRSVRLAPSCSDPTATGRLGRLFSARVRERTTRLTSLPVLDCPGATDGRPAGRFPGVAERSRPSPRLDPRVGLRGMRPRPGTPSQSAWAWTGFRSPSPRRRVSAGQACSSAGRDDLSGPTNGWMHPKEDHDLF